MNDDDSDFVNDLVDDPQQQLDTNDLQACLGHDSVQAMLMEQQVDSCGDLIGHPQADPGLHLSHPLENVPKESSVRMSVPLQLQHHPQQHQLLQHEHQHVYSLTSL
jgi:hypothetical protein